MDRIIYVLFVLRSVMAHMESLHNQVADCPYIWNSTPKICRFNGDSARVS